MTRIFTQTPCNPYVPINELALILASVQQLGLLMGSCKPKLPTPAAAGQETTGCNMKLISVARPCRATGTDARTQIEVRCAAIMLAESLRYWKGMGKHN